MLINHYPLRPFPPDKHIRSECTAGSHTKKKVPVSFAQLPPPEQRAETMGASSEARLHPMPNDQVMDKKNKLAKVPRDVLKSMSNIGAKNYIKVG